MMKVMYFQDPRGNFGDELNPWLWSRLFGKYISGYGNHAASNAQKNANNNANNNVNNNVNNNDSDQLLFYGIGTILDNRIPEPPEKIIFGSGYGYGLKPNNLDRCRVSFVRGRKTAEVLGIGADKALTDPAILLRRFFPLVPERDKIYSVSFIPHHTTAAGGYWQRACTALGIHYIDPLGFDIAAVVNDISSSKLVIAEAMHGAIVADTFRVPWIPVSSVRETNTFKWQDWCGTLNLDYAPIKLTAIFPPRQDSPFKAAVNTLKLALRKRELGALMNTQDAIMLSDESLLNTYLQNMDIKVAELDSYLHQRAAGGG